MPAPLSEPAARSPAASGRFARRQLPYFSVPFVVAPRGRISSAQSFFSHWSHKHVEIIRHFHSGLLWSCLLCQRCVGLQWWLLLATSELLRNEYEHERPDAGNAWYAGDARAAAGECRQPVSHVLVPAGADALSVVWPVARERL